MRCSGRTLPDDDTLFGPIRQAREAKNGKQPGNPVKADRSMLALIERPTPPAPLYQGSDAPGLVRQKLAALRQ